MLTELLLPRDERGLTVGSITVEVDLPEPVLIAGAGYKLLKSLSNAGCPGNPWGSQGSRYASLGPITDGKGRTLLYIEKGWKKKLSQTPKIKVVGPLTFTAYWAGPGEKYVKRLIECMGKTTDVSISKASVQILYEEPATTGTIHLVTPAQFKFSARASGGLVLPYPSAWRWVKTGIDLVMGGRENQRAYSLLARHLEIVEGFLHKVTVYISREKPTNWSISGWVRVEATSRAPDRVLTLLGWGLRLAEYLGVGKSRLEGLGRARVEKVL